MSGLVKVRYWSPPTRLRNLLGLENSSELCERCLPLQGMGVEIGLQALMSARAKRSNACRC